MAVSREFLVKLVGDAKQLIGTFDKVKDEAQASLGSGGLGGKLSSLLPSFKTIAVAGTAAFGAVSAAAGLAVKAAAEDAQSQALLAQALETTFGKSEQLVASTERFISETSKAAAVADDQLRPALSTLVRATGDLTQSQKLLEVALDISAGTGRDLEQVTLGLARASQGQFTALTRLGVPLDQNAVKAKDFDAVLRTLSDTFEGAAAASADSAQGRFRAFGIAVDELQEQFGALLLPALTEVVGYLTNKVIPAVSMAVDEFRSTGVRQALAVFVAAFGEAGIAILDNLESVALGIYKFMEGVVATLSPLFAAIDLVRAAVALGKPIESIQGAIERRTREVQGAFDGFRDTVDRTAKRLDIIAQGPLDTVERRLAQVTQNAKGSKQSMAEFGDETDKTGGKVKKAADDVKKFADRQKDYNKAVTDGQSALKSFTNSQKRSEDRRKSLIDTENDLKKAQQELAKAQMGGTPEEIAAAQRKVAAAERGVARSKFDVEESLIAVRDAEKELAELRKDPESTPDEIRRAEIRLAEAKFAVVDAEDRQIEVTDSLTEARRQLRIATDGLREGDAELAPFQDAVLKLAIRAKDASDDYREALEDETDALENYRKALEEVAKAAASVPKFSAQNPSGLPPIPEIPTPTPGGSFTSGQRQMPDTVNVTVNSSVVNPQQVGQEIADYLRAYHLGGGDQRYYTAV